MEDSTKELKSRLQQTIEMWDDSIRAAGFTSEDVQYASRLSISTMPKDQCH